MGLLGTFVKAIATKLGSFVGGIIILIIIVWFVSRCPCSMMPTHRRSYCGSY